MQERAVEPAALNHVALVPDGLLTGFSDAATQRIVRCSGGEGEVERDGCGRVLGDVQLERLERLDDLDLHRSRDKCVRVVAEMTDVAAPGVRRRRSGRVARRPSRPASETTPT